MTNANTASDGRVTVLVSIAAGILGAAGTVAALSRSQLVEVVLLVAAVAPWLISLPWWVNWSGWRWVLMATISASAMAGYVVRLYASDEPPWPPEPSPVVSTSASPTASTAVFAFAKPLENSIVPACLEVSGTGVLAKGKTLAVGIKEENDDRYYLESQINFDDPATWKVIVYFGDLDTTSSDGHEFTLLAVLMDSDMAKFAASINTDPDAGTWWSSTVLPPGSEIVATRHVERGKQKGECG